MRILGIDPGLTKTGWGIIESEGSSLKYVDSGLIKSAASAPLAVRLSALDRELARVLTTYRIDEAAVEETFVNRNPASALKLGQARGVALLCPARAGLPVGEYAANLIKKTIVGTGHATKDQIGMMIKVLLPRSPKLSEDEADALAVALCHAQHRLSHARIQKAAE